MSPIEILAAGLGLANVFLIARRNLWNWPIGIAMTLLYTWIFYDAKLYSDAILQIFFTVVQVIGWMQWHNGRVDDGDILTTFNGGAYLAKSYLAAAVVAVAFGSFFHFFTDASYPWIDAWVLGLSVVGQFLLNWRKVEAWIIWVTVDIVAVPLYFAKGLYVTSGLYVVFLVLAIYGFYQWYVKSTEVSKPA